MVRHRNLSVRRAVRYDHTLTGRRERAAKLLHYPLVPMVAIAGVRRCPHWLRLAWVWPCTCWRTRVRKITIAGCARHWRCSALAIVKRVLNDRGRQR